MKKTFEEPAIEVICFTNNDVMCDSSGVYVGSIRITATEEDEVTDK